MQWCRMRTWKRTSTTRPSSNSSCCIFKCNISWGNSNSNSNNSSNSNNCNCSSSNSNSNSKNNSNNNSFTNNNSNNNYIIRCATGRCSTTARRRRLRFPFLTEVRRFTEFYRVFHPVRSSDSLVCSFFSLSHFFLQNVRWASTGRVRPKRTGKWSGARTTRTTWLKSEPIIDFHGNGFAVSSLFISDLRVCTIESCIRPNYLSTSITSDCNRLSSCPLTKKKN